jgi:hypothetical protein
MFDLTNLNDDQEYPTLPALNFSAAPKIAVPSISGSAMLVELSIRNWAGRKLDKSASQKVTIDNRASTGVANVHKKLLGDCAELSAVIKFAGNARNAHYAMTMPWSDTGMRLLPTSRYFKYNEQMIALKAEYFTLVDTFLASYNWEITQAQVKLGDLFNPNEYPSAASLQSKFGFGYTYIPISEAKDWRIDIEAGAKEELAQHYQSYYQNQLHAAMADVNRRARDVAERMSERLDYSDNETKKVFRDSLVNNVLEIVDLMDACNLTGDPVMRDNAQALRDALTGLDADDLREDHRLRRATKKAVDDVIASLPSLGF